MGRAKRIEFEVDENGCWVCTSHSPNTGGYPQISIRGRHDLISRVILRKKMGGKIPKGICALHTCDNTMCIRPEHIFGGTQKRNMEDCAKKKRRKCIRGSKFWKAKVNENSVQEIREEWERGNRVYGEKGKLVLRLSQKYGIGEAAVRSIVNNRSWKHSIIKGGTEYDKSSEGAGREGSKG